MPQAVRQYPATIQCRTSFEQAGRIAGLAGDLGISESDVTRRLLTWGLERPGVLEELRREIRRDERAAERSLRRGLKRAQERGEAPEDLSVEDLLPHQGESE